MKNMRFSEFFFKNHFISSKVTRLHDLGHISMKKEGNFFNFVPSGFWFEKWMQAKVKENSGKSKF